MVVKDLLDGTSQNSDCPAFYMGCAVSCLATDRQENAIATVVVRGSTNNVMDDIERAVDDGVNTYKALTKVGGKVDHSKNTPEHVEAND